MKLQIVRVLQKYVLNPPNKLLFALGIVPPGSALLETIGRKTGKRRRTPVGDGRVENQFWIVAEHGMKAAYVKNIQAEPRVRVKVRRDYGPQWLSGTATIMRDDDPLARQQWLAHERPGSGRNAAAVRFFGTELLTVRIDLDQ